MLINLLAAEGENASSFWDYLWIIVIVVLLAAFLVWSFISQRKKQKQFNETINAIKPGSKVKTIGGIVGEVVEINDEEGTFVLRTGDSEGNFSYMKFDKQAIYQTDAKPEPVTEEKSEPAEAAEEKAEEPVSEAKEEVAEEKEEVSEEKKDETQDK